jgi:hypothetical protein
MNFYSMPQVVQFEVLRRVMLELASTGHRYIGTRRDRYQCRSSNKRAVKTGTTSDLHCSTLLEIR